MAQKETRECIECGGTAEHKSDSDTLYECSDCGTTFMDNPRWNERFNL